MTFFKRLLGIEEKSSNKNKEEDNSKFLPKDKPPIDELFMSKFIDNGGKFIYCESKKELFLNFDHIIEENNLDNKNIYSHNITRDSSFFEDKSINFSNDKTAQVLISNCEFLIAKDGSVLVSSNQVGEGSLSDLPHNFIVYAYTSQIIENIGEGLQHIKKKHSNKIPTGITSLKTFKEKEDVDFLSYGSIQKNLYLLLLEDL